ncbi:hypothetical protein B7C42_06615 [Nocardia cerradoensis]|uniref:DUF8020 domain-containing protein n=1 Tax=Nocardia cerradoensis TaxID=85688 RepID=A0A231GX77_9NOCA|nr:hypothetical protein [Nocardia cerradoensis]OXR41217.1 hypothetical protein B7C42_06615 [Nocardia cerradoensis]
MATVALATGAVAFASATARAAEPEAAVPGEVIQVGIAPGIQYTGNIVDNSAVVNTPFGSLTTRNGAFEVRDGQGGFVAGTPLTTPPDSDANSSRETDPAGMVTPGTDSNPGTVVTHPALENVDATADFNGALAVAATQFGLAVGVGTLAGGVVGLGVGCLAGAATGGFVALPTGPIAAPAALFGCIVGASVGAGIGGVTGAALLGIPVGIASAVQMYNTLQAPPAAPVPAPTVG